MAKQNGGKGLNATKTQIIVMAFFLVLVLGTLIVSTNIGADQRAKQKNEEAAAQMQENLQQEATGAATVASPVTEYPTSAALSEATGITLAAPAGADGIAYSSITVTGFDKPIAQVAFTLNGLNCSYRACQLPNSQDISGMYYEWATDETAVVNTVEWQVKVDAAGTAGIALNYSDDGLMRTVSVQGSGVTANSVTAVISALQR